MRLSAHDASFLYTESASGPMHGVGITILETPATYEEIFQYYAERIHLVPRLRQKLAFVPFNIAHPKWVDDEDFDLANHLQKYEVPPNTTLRGAEALALELGEPLLDRSRPLWLTYVMEDVEGKTLLAQMSHHAFVDGATAVAMSTVLTDPTPDAPPPNTPPEWQPEPAPSPQELWQEAMQENAGKSLSDLQNAPESAQAVAQLTQKGASLMQRMARPVMQAPFNASLVGPKRVISTRQYPLDELKPISKALGGTLNDVVVSVVSEAVARYLKSKGEMVEDQYLRLMCPVNVREADDDPLDMTGNRVSAMFPVLGAWPMPMAERYAHVKAELEDIKKNEEPWVLDKLQHIQPFVPPVAMAQTLSVGTQWDATAAAARAPLPILPVPGGVPRPQQLGFNFTCTNVAGPNWTQYVAGHKVEVTKGTLMLSGNLGFGSSVNSYDGVLNFNFTADPRLLPDIDELSNLLAETIAEIKQAAEEGAA